MLVSTPRPTVAIALDFDGTITEADTTDLLLGRFALPEWEAVEALWQAGTIDSRECLRRQVALIRATPAELDAAIDAVAVDPDFKDLVAEASIRGIDVRVVSDGFDRSIGRVLARVGVTLPFTANALRYVGNRRWRIGFPHAVAGCAAGSGVCKCAAKTDAAATVLVGDGRSDFCLAGRADLTFAKGRLGDHCADNALPHIAITRFADVLAWLEACGPDAGGRIREERRRQEAILDA